MLGSLMYGSKVAGAKRALQMDYKFYGTVKVAAKQVKWEI